MPDRFGPYAIEGELGRGTAGIVYRARHAGLDRPVALKILRDAAHLSPSLLERFHREALVTARLRHPHIVTVHDAGKIGDIPFIAMELVDGEFLDLSKLPLRRRVEVLAKVAEAVHHAHLHGIVHRDLKPGNILLDRLGEPRVVDFGLAHLVQERTRLTRSGIALGTPIYMSPEQVRGHPVGPRSDVFSLGVILYEGLAGRPPFDGSSIDDVYCSILMEDAPPLRTVSPELATVCLKALEKDPARRYATARAFAEDLARWLDGEPVHARPPSIAHRVKKFVARRKVIMTAAGGLVLAALVAVLTIPRLRAARKEAETASERLREAALYHPLEKELDLLRARFYQPDFRLTDDDFARYDELVRKIKAQMAQSAENAQGHYLIGRCREVIADHVGADEAYARALALDGDHAPSLLARGRLGIERALYRRTAFNDEESSRRAQEEARTAMDLIRRARSAGRASSIEFDLAQAYLELIEGWNAGVPYSSADMLAKWKNELFVEEFLLIDGLSHRGPALLDAASRILQRMPSSFKAYFWKASAQEQPDRRMDDLNMALRINPRFAEAYNNRAGAHSGKGDFDEAIADYSRAVEIDRAFAAAYNNRGNAHDHKGELLASTGRPREALAEWNAALADLSRAIEIDPRYSGAYNNRGNVRRHMGDLDGAIEDLSRAIEISPRLAEPHTNRGSVRLAKGDIEGAMEDHSRAIELDPRSDKAYNNRGVAHHVKGELLAAEGRPDEANSEQEAAIRDCSRAIQLNRRSDMAYNNRGNARQAMGDIDGAIADHGHAIEINPRSAEAHNNRALAYERKRDLDRAIADYTRAIEINPRLAQPWNNRGSVRAEKRDFDGAIADCTQAIEINPRYSEAHNNRGNAHKNKAEILAAEGRLDEAAAEREAALRDYSRAIKIDPRNATAHFNRGNTRAAKGDLDGAIQDYSRVIEINRHFFQAYVGRAGAHRAKGDFKRAADDLEHVLRIAPRNWPGRATAEASLKQLPPR